MNKITYNKQYIDNSDIKILSIAAKQKLITTGNFVKKFEKSFEKYLKVKNSISCINGTAGLDLAFKAIELNTNDVIVMPVVNFVASYSMANNLKAKIVLSDVDPITGQMTPQTLIDCIKKNRLKKIKAVVTMYLGGFAENIEKFHFLKRKYKFLLIEDACHALGSKYQIGNKIYRIGSCKHSDICVFSFHPVKSITTGEGGMVTTNNKIFAKKIKLIKNHNMIKSKNYWEYDIKKCSINYRLSDINCALGISQLKKIDKFLKARLEIYRYYSNQIKKSKFFSSLITLPKYGSVKNSSHHLFLMNFNFKKAKKTKNSFIKYLNKNKIFPQFHYKPLNMFSFYKKKKSMQFPGSVKYFKEALSMPIFYELKKKELDYIVKKINLFFA